MMTNDDEILRILRSIESNTGYITATDTEALENRLDAISNQLDSISGLLADIFNVLSQGD